MTTMTTKATSTCTIYTVRDRNYYEFGLYAEHYLSEPNISRQWIDRAEYELPDGYSVARANDNSLYIYDDESNYCPMCDNGHDAPAILLRSDELVNLNKVRNLPW